MNKLKTFFANIKAKAKEFKIALIDWFFNWQHYIVFFLVFLISGLNSLWINMADINNGVGALGIMLVTLGLAIFAKYFKFDKDKYKYK